jgi:undecaprenyl-diphosphatase
MIKSANEWLFLAINGTHGSSAVVIYMALALAEFAVPLVGVAMVMLWMRGPTDRRRAVLLAGLTGLLGLSVVQAIAALWYVPRPFQIGLGTQLMPHVPEASFPSDHATLMFCLSLAALRTRALRGWGAFGFGIAIAVAWARVFLGVHYPFDMVGGFIVGVASVGIMNLVPGQQLDALTATAERVSSAVLRWTRLPARIFPRP